MHKVRKVGQQVHKVAQECCLKLNNTHW